MLQYQFRPIDRWDGKTTVARDRRRSQFKADFNNTLRLLERELGYLDARNVVIQADCDERMIRQDGMMRVDARMRGPGIILSFESKHGPLSYPCDTFTDWTDNLRAIGLALEALRAVDRYGVTKGAEQYQGWARISGPTLDIALTPQQAVSVLLKASGSQDKSIARKQLEDVYRAACAATHPDVGGSAEEFKRVQTAKAVLDRHFGIAS